MFLCPSTISRFNYVNYTSTQELYYEFGFSVYWMTKHERFKIINWINELDLFFAIPNN